MKACEKKYVSALLGELVSALNGLCYPQHRKAEELYQRTRFLVYKYFAAHPIYSTTINEISFKRKGNYNEQIHWEEACGRLLAIVKSMRDEVQLEASNDNSNAFKDLQKIRRIISAILLLFFSFLLWSFHRWFPFVWLEQHPKRLAIYFSFQLLLFLVCLFIFLGRRLGVGEFVSLGFSLLIGLVSIF